ncbi:MAG: hypothetical protein HUK26_08075, partial [Duodenibacillus sp.]|nr:hypothetical protein [Duodenibacillus sp.]
QTGYLTIRGAEDRDFLLGYPNDEVRGAMAALYAKLLAGGRAWEERFPGHGLSAICRAGDAGRFAEALNGLFPGLDVSEAEDCAGVLAAVLTCAGIEARRVPGQTRGCRVEIKAGGWIWAVGLAVAEDEGAAEGKLEEIAAQPEPGRRGDGRLLRLALAFSKGSGRFYARRAGAQPAGRPAAP